MKRTTKFLINMQRILKLHESMLRVICEEYHLSQTEAAVISFLYNNPGKDTAADIVELRGLQKSNVSQAVETLYQKSLLTRQQDSADRRKIHLFLTREADPIVQSMIKIRQEFGDRIFAGLTREEQETFVRINEKIQNNLQAAAERRE